MTSILKNWHFMRIFRAIFAGLIFSQVWQTGEWLLAIPGGIFALQAIFDVGCCGAAGCAAPQQMVKNTTGKAEEEVVFEEVR
jgi:hypothetical protein